jgi:hypothetical protein
MVAMIMRFLVLSTLLVGMLGPSVASAQLAAGWSHFDVENPSTSYDAYIPASLDTTEPARVIVFLHRGDKTPLDYREALQSAADEVDAVLVLPVATSAFGWGFPGDGNAIQSAVDHLAESVDVNESRVSLSGHGDGGVFALERLLDPTTKYSAFFGVGVSLASLPTEQELEYLPPVRLYYGEDDPSREEVLETLRSELEGRGLSVEVEVLAGNDADDLPGEAIAAGFEFLVSKRRTGPISQYGCENTEEALCLTDGRFKVTVSWETEEGDPGVGKVASLRSDGSGLFWFFNEKNWELLVKVLDGCQLNEHFWVFSAASTNIAYTLTVEDLLAQTSVQYDNAQGQAAPAINDTNALETCEPPEETPAG